MSEHTRAPNAAAMLEGADVLCSHHCAQFESPRKLELAETKLEA